MDPIANLKRQREIAQELLELSDVAEGHRPNGHVVELAFELAEHVQALDEWRRRGGFDPYGGERSEWVIAGAVDPEDGTLYWSNEDGWGALASATVFSLTERAGEYVNLPMDDEARWVQLPGGER